MKIQNILATKGANSITIHPEQSLKDAVILLGKHNIGALVVVDEAGKLVGMLSERDIVRQAMYREDLFLLPVSHVMTERVVTGTPDDDLKSVMHRMTEGRFRHLPVVEQGKLVGVVSIGDVVKAVLAEYQGEIETLETQVMEA
ncbi:MAG: CBS domain-containing protein [Chloroflexi bacterium]|nr:CBS domain-containing protein [Chloroflexota bacterium]